MSNPQIELARRYIEQTGTSLFLTGKAGTGKTTFLKEIDRNCSKRHIVVAPTGVAAINAGGVTIHSFFQLPFDPYLPDVKELVTEYQVTKSRHSISKNKLNIIRTLELLIIDEISMVRADLMDAIDMTLRRLRHSSKPFGGVQLLMIGDVHQLPPVVTERERPYMERVYPSPFFFHSKALAKLNYVTIELTEVFRQQDSVFVNILNNIRENRIDQDTLQILSSRVGKPTDDAITLTTHNRQADEINNRQMAALKTQERTFKGIVKGNFPESTMPIEPTVHLKKGERVMFIKNDSTGMRRYYNGKIATIEGFSDSGNNQDDEHIIVKDDDGQTIQVEREIWENIKYTINDSDGSIEQTIDGTYSQFPLRPAWAITIHKAQGLTFDKVSVDAAEAFAFGQVYVALSRCRTLQGLTLTTAISPRVAFSDDGVEQFCKSLPTFEDTSNDILRHEQAYYLDQLHSLFSFSTIKGEVFRLLSAYGKVISIYPKNYNSLQAIYKHLSELENVSERFATWLEQTPREQHEARLHNAAEYYLKETNEMQEAIETLTDIKPDNKETDKQISDIGTIVKESLGIKTVCLKALFDSGYDIVAIQAARSNYLIAGKNSDKKMSTKKKASTGTASDQIVKALSEWRAAKAAEMGTKAFVILHQKTLVQIAEQKPSTIEELLSIPYVGKTKAELYGKDILKIVELNTNRT